MQINVKEYRRGNHKMDNLEKLATYGAQGKDKQNKDTTIRVILEDIAQLIFSQCISVGFFVQSKWYKLSIRVNKY